MLRTMQRLEIGGGVLNETRDCMSLQLPPSDHRYADAQLSDYGGLARREYPWSVGLEMTLSARFSLAQERLKGTAGFGFWNAPFGDPSVPWPTLPQATWFFYASEPNDLPVAPAGAGRGWFAGTVDATRWRALRWAPTTPAVLLLNQIPAIKRQLWPRVQRDLGMSFAPIHASMQAWHQYRLSWQATGCRFWVDNELLLETPQSPQGPLGFVCWIDNQYLIATGTGRFKWGVLTTTETQSLYVRNLEIQPKLETQK